MTATAGSGGLSGSGNWAGLGAAMVEGAGQSLVQPQSGASSAAQSLSLRSTVADAQAQQADVMLTLSEGAQSLLANGGAAGAVVATAGTNALAADVMQAADAVLNDPSATVEQKAMAKQLMQVATTMTTQSASGAAGTSASQLAGQSTLAAQPGGLLGGAVVTSSGLYGLTSTAMQESARNMAFALLGTSTAQAEEIVLPGGIVQLPQNTEEAVAASAAGLSELSGNALSNALLPELFEAMASVLSDENATTEQKQAATALLQTFEASDDSAQIPQALLNPLLAAALMPAVSPSIRGRLVRAALAEDVEDMGQTEEAEASGRFVAGAGGLRAVLARNAAYLASVQKPLLNHVLQLIQRQEAEAVEAGLAGWGTAQLSREQLAEEALQSSAILVSSQDLMAESTYMGALASTSLTPILIMSWAALLSGFLPRAYPFVPRVRRRANKKKWRRKKQNQKMDFQNLLFMGNAVDAQA